MINKLNIVILAAGKGTRMYSTKPKVLHKLAGKPLLQHVIDCAKQLNPEKIIVVYGYGGNEVVQAFAHEKIIWVEQKEQLGTGDAVIQALPFLTENGTSLILLGDVPLINANSCEELLKLNSTLGLLTVFKNDPTGYGRILRDQQNNVNAIVEHKDADEEQKKIQEVNTGIIACHNDKLVHWLSKLTNNNAQKEYYLTDIVTMAVSDGNDVKALTVNDESSVEGVNSKSDLAGLERAYQIRYATTLMQQGLTLADPFRIDVRGELVIGKDIEIDVGCVFEGKVEIEDNVSIGAYCVIKNARIGAGTRVAPFTHVDDVEIGKDNRIGPYARLRPGTKLESDTHIGNFVELKNTQVNQGSKINHLSYVGDTTVGKNVNIGAGTITCNYDGVNKFRTVIEDNVFIGSDTKLVAPVTVGAGATIGAGSVITKNAPAGELTIARAKQMTLVGWSRPVKLKS
jgi:bifunctional UDP-N-acetylglucosamine pyrophosphorylase / glucosamine-1-phosphate N-acetyltransferase